MSKEKQLYEILRSLQRGEIGTDLAHLKILRLFAVSGSVCKCPICLEEMKGIELTHYKCKKCNEYFTN